MKKYDKPDLRIAPLWACSINTLFYFQVREDGEVIASVRVTDGEPYKGFWHRPARSATWTPLLPYGTEPPELPLVIEPGRWYETRGGKKAFVGCCNPDRKSHPFLGYIAGEATMFSWTTGGVWYASGGRAVRPHPRNGPTMPNTIALAITLIILIATFIRELRNANF